MSGETAASAVSSNNSNIVDLLSTLNPAAATSSTVTLTPSTGTMRTDDMNVDSSDFVPANRLLVQRQALANSKQSQYHCHTICEIHRWKQLSFLFQWSHFENNNNCKIWKSMINKRSKSRSPSIGKRPIVFVVFVVVELRRFWSFSNAFHTLNEF